MRQIRMRGKRTHEVLDAPDKGTGAVEPLAVFLLLGIHDFTPSSYGPKSYLLPIFAYGISK